MADAPHASTLTIGAVLARLKPEFDDVSISKIRFLESEGLVAPARTRAGYRVYSEADVERLRYVLTAQRDRFWPLKVIREALDAMDRGLEAPSPQQPRPQAPAPPVDADVPAPAFFATEPSGVAPTIRLTADELSRSSGLDPRTLEAMVTYGLLRRDPGGLFDASAMPVASAAAALASFGIEARHLRPFRTAADREIGLVEQVLAPLRGRQDDVAAERRADLLHQCLALHAALVKAGLTPR